MRPVGTEPLLESGDWPKGATAPRGLVLPRFLRKPVRLIGRLEWHIPRHAGLKGGALFLAATAIAGMVIGGHTDRTISAVTAWAGLAIDEVEISGQSEVSEFDVLESMALGPYPSIVTFDAIAARERVESLPWVEQATIRKLYPDTLQVAIVEKEPYAIWQRDRWVSLIDKDGRIIANRIGSRYSGLPMVVGEGAEKRAGEFVRLLEDFPSLAPRVRAGVLVSGRRWNVVLNNGIEIMLPEDDPGSALIQVVALDDGHEIFSREIAAVDLRQASRLIFRLSETGYEAREDLLEARDKKRSNT